MHAVYGRRFLDMWADQPVEQVKSAWADTLAGYTRAELQRGLRRLPASWPPDAFEFAALCRATSASPDSLFYQAVELQRLRHQGIDVVWPTAAVFWAACSLGRDLQAQPYATLKNRWIAALEQAQAEIDAGRRPNAVPPHYDTLPAPGAGITDRATARAKMAEIKRLLK